MPSYQGEPNNNQSKVENVAVTQIERPATKPEKDSIRCGYEGVNGPNAVGSTRKQLSVK